MNKEINEILYSYKTKIESRKAIFIRKSTEIIDTLGKKNLDTIMFTFNYSNMKRNFFSYCSLYKSGNVCHDLLPESMNCFNCFCPNYLVETLLCGETQRYFLGICAINSEYKEYTISKKFCNRMNLHILNCSKCLIPHQGDFIEEQLRKSSK